MRLPRHLSIASAVIGIVLVGQMAACSASSTSNKPSPATATSASISAQAFDSAASSAAGLVLLKTADLPTGWTGSPHTPTPLTGFTGECAPLNPDDPITGSALSKSSDDFAGPGGDDALSQADVFTSKDAASTSFTSLANVIAYCHDQFVSVFTNLFSQAGAAYVGVNDPNASVTDIQVSFVSLRGPGYGDESQAYRLSFGFSVSGKRVSGATDAIFMRSGAIVADLDHTALSGDTALTQQLAKTIADRVAVANRQLPQ